MTINQPARVWRSELLKARTSPVTWGFAAAIILLTAINTSLSLGDPLSDLTVDEGVRHAFTAGRDFAVLFIALGAVGAAGEFRHHTSVPTFLTTPARHRVLAAKASAYAVVGALLAVGCVVAQMAIALPWIAHEAGAVSPFEAAVWEPAVTTVLSGLAYAAIGVGIGTLLRNQVVALTVTFGWFTVAENVLASVAPDVSRYLPGGLFSSTEQAELLAVPVALALLATYAVALAAVASRTTLRRDI